MRRWNGWGDEVTNYPLTESTDQYLERMIGPGCIEPDVSFERALEAVPASRLPAHPLFSTDGEQRLRHACGQSLPDWVALRSGRIRTFPDGVAYPSTDEEVREVLDFSRRHGIRLIPYGGGTSVVGHVNPLPDGIPTLTVDLSKMDRLLELDETSRLATFGAGANGPAVEKQLRRHGYTLGHFPQSFELSTLGGWITTRSSGQQSAYYGRIEDLFAGGHAETPLGSLDVPVFPASAAGPDLKQLILGSEGRLGILTRATVRVRPFPEFERFYGVFFRDWLSGIEAVRAIAQAGMPASMLRLSDALETETTLQLSGKEKLVRTADKGLGVLGFGAGRCLLVYGVTGSREAAAFANRQIRSLLRKYRGLYTGETVGKIWQKSRFRTPYLRNTLWEHGFATDTLETALPWKAVDQAAGAIKAALRTALAAAGTPEQSAKAMVFAHLSHVYPDGASIYVTYIFPRGVDPDETLHRWQILKRAGSQAVVNHGGTISHQHGVGTDHAPYLPIEKGRVGMALIEAVCEKLDPEGLLNPGKLVERPTMDDGRWTKDEGRRANNVGKWLA